MTDDEKVRQRLFIGVIVANVAVIVVMLLLYLTYSGPMGDFPTFGYAMRSLFLGLLVGGAAFGVCHYLDLP